MRGTLTIGQASQVALARIAHKAQGVEVAPVLLTRDFGAPFDPNNELYAQLLQYVYQRHIGKAPVGRHDQAAVVQLPVAST